MGPAALETLAPELDALIAATGGPLTARSTWLRAWASVHPTFEPWAVVVRDRRSGCLDAAAILCRRELSGRVDIAPLGFGRNDRSRLPARDTAAAALLADRLVTELSRLGSPWTMRVEQLPAADPVAAALVARLPLSALVPGGDVPHVRFDRAQELVAEDHLANGARKALRKARNRLAADGHDLQLQRETRPAQVRQLLEEVAVVHRGRDRAQGRDSDLDTPEGERFWWTVLQDHADRGEVEVTTLRAGQVLVAYVLGFLDDDAYRVFDGRFATEWARYSPGRLVETATLGRALADPRFEMLDWMNSVAPDKLVAANGVEHTQHVVACSASLLRLPAAGAPDLLVDLHGAPTADPALLALSGAGRDLKCRGAAGPWSAKRALSPDCPGPSRSAVAGDGEQVAGRSTGSLSLRPDPSELSSEVDADDGDLDEAAGSGVVVDGQVAEHGWPGAGSDG